ncbi:uncharacterized protein LOC106666352 isoform X3 [Cimex lectularius]|nr:uncharacterized protein LOC106666352 isoform X3 [Cimex lectularius]XP_024085847.1 uncharacterized protein LOC106666352 isoform X3 [Cimex lectularius]XP_024085848.1 uncharacterized protein LOC106666352 isoform X3 [Cimex lectularius]
MDSQKQESKHAIDLFLKLSSFLRFSLQEILPNSTDKYGIEIPRIVFDEIENLVSSVTDFINAFKKCDATEPKVDKINKPALWIDQDNIKEPESWTNEKNKQTDYGMELDQTVVSEMWIDMFKEMQNSINKNTGKLGKKGFYCGLCNYYSLSKEEWKKHFVDRNHIRIYDLALEEAKCAIKTSQCHFCGVELFSEVPHLDAIFKSSIHQRIHGVIMTSKDSTNSSNNTNRNIDIHSFGLNLKAEIYSVPNNSNLTNNEIVDKATSYSQRSIIEKGTSQNKEKKLIKNSKSKNSAGSCISQSKESENRVEIKKEFDFKEKEFKNKQQTGNLKKTKTPNNVNFNQEKSQQLALQFQNLNRTLSSQKDSEGYYCKPCGMAFEKKPDWDNHCQNIVHKTANILHQCQFCKFSLLSFKKDAGDYMEYHMKICHPEHSTGSNKSKKSKQTKNAQQSEEKCLEFSHSPAHYSSTTSLNGPSTHNSSFPRQEITENPREQINPKFFDLLKVKQYSSNIRNFKGLCLKCDIDFSCQFEWVSHFHSHPINTDEEVIECQKCNLGVFGNREIIKTLYMQHPDHISLDRQST